MKIAYSSQMRELDRLTIEETGIPAEVLMENAGREVVAVLIDRFPSLINLSVTILCGPGNNGGDGFVIARHLINRGGDCCVFLFGKKENQTGAARIHAEIASNMEIPIIEIASETDLELVLETVLKADLIVDSLFGTGLHRPLGSIYSKLIQTVNDSDAAIVSVDLPSGLSSDSCVPIGPTIHADITVTFGLPKPALILYPTAEYAGQVVVADISIPRTNVEKLDIQGNILTPYQFPALFQPRAADCHKGTLGHLLIIAGSPGKTGAAILSATAAARAGSGLVTLAIPEPLNLIAETRLTEVMSLPLPGLSTHFCPEHIPALLAALPGKSAVLIGPGLGTHRATADFLRAIMQEVDIPLILDADALNIISASAGPWFSGKIPRVLTPHPGEFCRLTDSSMQSLMQNPIDIVTDYATSTSSIVVLKTARTIIAFPDGRYYLNITGNPGLATGGTGDVLAGMISGLAARFLCTEQASTAGVFWHGLTGDITAYFKGEEEMLAGDLFEFMADARLLLSENVDFFNGVHIPYPDIDFMLNSED